MKIVYIACENADLTEGRGPYVPKCGSFDKKTAEALSKGLRGVYGTPNDCPLLRIPIYDSIEDAGEKATDAELKKFHKQLKSLKDSNPKIFARALEELK